MNVGLKRQLTGAAGIVLLAAAAVVVVALAIMSFSTVDSSVTWAFSFGTSAFAWAFALLALGVGKLAKRINQWSKAKGDWK